MDPAIAENDSLPWEPSALSEVMQAPKHLHEMIRSLCEEHARSMGKSQVDMEVVAALQGDHGKSNKSKPQGVSPVASAPDAAHANSATGENNSVAGSTSSGSAHATGASGADSAIADSGAEDFSELFAEEGVDPLEGAFLRRSPPHVSLPSQRVDPAELQMTWQKAMREVLPRQNRRSLYIHVPFCRCRCSYCPFYLMAYREQAAEEYVELLLRDIELTAAQVPASDRDSGGEFQAIFFGGGTPSDLSAEQLAKLLKALRRNFALSADCEITVEGRVRGFDKDKAQACRDAGATRISLGVQCFDTAVRQGVGRFADEAEVRSTLEALGSIDGLALNIDLIYGLPGQDAKCWEKDIRLVNEIGGIRGVDLYELKRIPGSPLTKAQSMGRVEHGAEMGERARMYRYGAQALESAGWERLSCCHWGRGGNRQNRYNVYAKSGAACLPFGCSSGGRIGRLSLGGPQDVEAYKQMLDLGHKPLSGARWLDPASTIHDKIAAQLEFGRLDPDSASAGLSARLRPLLNQWQRAGLLESEGDSLDQTWGLTLAGRFWIKELSSRLAKALS